MPPTVAQETRGISFFLYQTKSDRARSEFKDGSEKAKADGPDSSVNSQVSNRIIEGQESTNSRDNGPISQPEERPNDVHKL